MPDEKESKSLEMRVAAIEDKLSKIHVTEEEMKAYEKVSSLMGMGTAAQGTQLSPQLCQCQISRVVFCWPPRGIVRPIITICECQCGPCNCQQGGGGFGGFGGGFGGFGG
jgi:hypothetical protein